MVDDREPQILGVFHLNLGSTGMRRRAPRHHSGRRIDRVVHGLSDGALQDVAFFVFNDPVDVWLGVEAPAGSVVVEVPADLLRRSEGLVNGCCIVTDPQRAEKVVGPACSYTAFALERVCEHRPARTSGVGGRRPQSEPSTIRSMAVRPGDVDLRDLRDLAPLRPTVSRLRIVAPA